MIKITSYQPITPISKIPKVQQGYRPLDKVEEKNQDSVSISEESKKSFESENAEFKAPNGEPLSEDQVRQVKELKKRDVEVRRHENAHLAALGPYKTGGESYEFQTAPNGKKYAIGGEVPVDLSPASTPQESVIKFQTIRRAALAPEEPSTADRQVAAQATQLEMQARKEVQEETTEKTDSVNKNESINEVSINEIDEKATDTPTSKPVQAYKPQTNGPAGLNLNLLA